MLYIHDAVTGELLAQAINKGQIKRFCANNKINPKNIKVSQLNLETESEESTIIDNSFGSFFTSDE